MKNIKHENTWPSNFTSKCPLENYWVIQLSSWWNRPGAMNWAPIVVPECCFCVFSKSCFIVHPRYRCGPNNPFTYKPNLCRFSYNVFGNGPHGVVLEKILYTHERANLYGNFNLNNVIRGVLSTKYIYLLNFIEVLVLIFNN